MLDSLSVDGVAHGEPLPFGLEPTPMEAIGPAYLANDTFRSRYVRWRMRMQHG
jgi:NADH dehydrogenase